MIFMYGFQNYFSKMSAEKKDHINPLIPLSGQFYQMLQNDNIFPIFFPENRI